MSEEVDFTQLAPGFVDALAGDRNGDLASSSTAGGEREAEGSREGSEGEGRKGAGREYYFGCGPWHPPQLQVFRDARVFTFLLCLFATIEGALVSGFTSIVLSSLERRYGLSSTAAGSIASTFDAAVLVSVIFISYVGGRGHKPRWLGASLIVQAVGTFIFALPQFLFGPYQVGSTGSLDTESCLDGQDFSSDCASSNKAALAFFLIGNIFIGIGAAPLFTVGTSYLDEIIHPSKVSIHLGLFYMLAVVGPALGYALGGVFLTIYVDPWVDTHLQTSDPGWVGAWWLCFLFCGIVSLIIAIPFFCFPRLLPDGEAIRLAREKEMAKKCEGKQEVDGQSELQSVLKSFPQELKKILINPSWAFITIAIAVSTIVVAGFASFAPKYVETQFGLSAAASSLAIGAIAIPTGGVGVVVGGLIIHFLKIKGRQVALLQLALSVLAIFPLLGILIHCPTFDLAGVTTAYPDGTVNLPDTQALNSSCVTDCNCTSSVFVPVCGADDIVYFSPCYAGCLATGNSTGADFEQCSCVADRLFSVSANVSYSDLLLSNSTASDGQCDSGCGLKLAFFLVLIGVTLFVVFTLQIPKIIITIRCVAEDQRTLALGLQSFFWRLFGSIPGPIIFGVIFDSACLFWQQDCGRRGNCWVYDNTALSVRAVVLAVLAMVAYIIFNFLCWITYPRTPASGEDSENGVAKPGDSLANGDAAAVEKVYIRESGAGGGGNTSVIGQMQLRNSTADLLEVDDRVEAGSNRNSPSSYDEMGSDL